jgi:hypothetical protein
MIQTPVKGTTLDIIALGTQFQYMNFGDTYIFKPIVVDSIVSRGRKGTDQIGFCTEDRTFVAAQDSHSFNHLVNTY